MSETHYLYGSIPVRVIEEMPEYIIGADGREYLTLFWQGAEIARIRRREAPKYKFTWNAIDNTVLVEAAPLD